VIHRANETKKDADKRANAAARAETERTARPQRSLG
jgi:hypothetical protein